MLNVFIAFLKLARCVYEVIDMSKPKGHSGASRVPSELHARYPSAKRTDKYLMTRFVTRLEYLDQKKISSVARAES